MSLASNGDGIFKTLARLRLNPGSRLTFPWLSVMAPLYETYRFRRIKFILVTRVPTTTTGNLVMSPDYDAADGEIAITEQFIFNNMGSTDSPIWEKSHTLNLSPQAMNRLYKSHVCMSDARFSATSQDAKTIDAGQVFICTDHSGSALTIGKLLVDYEVEFFNPQSPTDPLQFGGVRIAQQNPNLNNNQPLSPIAAGVANFIVNREEAVPIVKFPGTDPVSTATVLQFVRDYQGIVNLLHQGSGINSAAIGAAGGANLFLDKFSGLVGATSTPVSSLADLPTIVDSAASKRVDAFNLSAKAGDFLKVTAPGNTTINDLKVILGGSSVPLITL